MAIYFLYLIIVWNKKPKCTWKTLILWFIRFYTEIKISMNTGGSVKYCYKVTSDSIRPQRGLARQVGIVGNGIYVPFSIKKKMCLRVIVRSLIVTKGYLIIRMKRDTSSSIVCSVTAQCTVLCDDFTVFFLAFIHHFMYGRI